MKKPLSQEDEFIEKLKTTFTPPDGVPSRNVLTIISSIEDGGRPDLLWGNQNGYVETNLVQVDDTRSYREARLTVAGVMLLMYENIK